jgi:hypothetical protein
VTKSQKIPGPTSDKLTEARVVKGNISAVCFVWQYEIFFEDHGCTKALIFGCPQHQLVHSCGLLKMIQVLLLQATVCLDHVQH